MDRPGAKNLSGQLERRDDALILVDQCQIYLLLGGKGCSATFTLAPCGYWYRNRNGRALPVPTVFPAFAQKPGTTGHIVRTWQRRTPWPICCHDPNLASSRHICCRQLGCSQPLTTCCTKGQEPGGDYDSLSTASCSLVSPDARLCLQGFAFVVQLSLLNNMWLLRLRD
jgi:hypothetical protein